MEYNLSTSPKLSADDKNLNETFVYKLYRMVEDPSHQHLLSWSYSGHSFIVSNAMEFARDVLPKYFKHNNFSSYVRQLNMYGFHKVNESPRSPRSGSGSGESQQQQIWEFSHPRFVRGHPEWLVDIKRKVVSSGSGGKSPPFSQSAEMPESELYNQAAATTMKRPGDIDLINQMGIMQALQSEMMRQINEMQDNFVLVMRELSETRRRLAVHREANVKLVDLLARQQAALLPPNSKLFDVSEFNFLLEDRRADQQPSSGPPIFVSSSDFPASSNLFAAGQSSVSQVQAPHPSGSSIPGGQPGLYYNQLNANTLYPLSQPGMKSSGLEVPSHGGSIPIISHGRSSSYTNAVNTPLPPSPIGSPHQGSPINDILEEDDFMEDPHVKHESWPYES